jgi:4a-hydroxytetrahydrobiopterin dehydratase
MALLSPAEIAQRLTLLSDWQRSGETIERTLTFADFVAAMTFVNGVAQEAEKAGHHPDIDIRWNRVRLVLTSHDAGGLTIRDFKLAAVIDSLISSGGS